MNLYAAVQKCTYMLLGYKAQTAFCPGMQILAIVQQPGKGKGKGGTTDKGGVQPGCNCAIS